MSIKELRKLKRALLQANTPTREEEVAKAKINKYTKIKWYNRREKNE